MDGPTFMAVAALVAGREGGRCSCRTRGRAKATRATGIDSRPRRWRHASVAWQHEPSGPPVPPRLGEHAVDVRAGPGVVPVAWQIARYTRDVFREPAPLAGLG